MKHWKLPGMPSLVSFFASTGLEWRIKFAALFIPQLPIAAEVDDIDI